MYFFFFFILYRYFILDLESGILQYFVTEASKNQKPRGSLSLAGSLVSQSDEAPFMILVYSANGEVYKLKGKFFLKESSTKQEFIKPYKIRAL